MQEIIPAVDRELLKKELNAERFLRYTNNGNNELYLVNYHNSPNTLREIGRLRELTFRQAGGGTGQELDLDENDICENCYYQLVSWNPVDEEVIAGYRVISGNRVLREDGGFDMSTAHYFNLSQQFIDEFLPYSLELGRSFVQPRYQPSKNNRKGLFSLDNLWDGLGAFVLLNPQIKYLFGKVTMYPHFKPEARDLIMYFLNHYFEDKDKLITAKNELKYKTDISAIKGMFDGLEYKQGYKLLNSKVREMGENIPPLVNTYMNLSPSMRVFGTAINQDFGDVEETGILIVLDDIYPAKKERHMSTFERDRHFGQPAKK